MSKRGCRPMLVCIAGAGLCVLVAVTAFLLFPPTSRRTRPRAMTCQVLLHMLANDFHKHAHANDGCFPERDSLGAFRAINAPYPFVSRTRFLCVEDRIRTAAASKAEIYQDNISYVYVYRPRSEGGPVLLDKQGNHQGECNVLYLGETPAADRLARLPDGRVAQELGEWLPKCWWEEARSPTRP